MIDTSKFSGIAKKGFNDKCDIYGYCDSINESGVTVNKRVIKYKNIPCRISFMVSYSNIRAAENSDTVAEASQRVKIFLPNDINVESGSEFVVEHRGVKNEYVLSGIPRVYGSHTEVLVNYGEKYC